MSIDSAVVARPLPPSPGPGWAADPLAWIATARIRSLAPASAVLFCVLLAVAVATGGTAFDAWDVPVQRWIEASRTALLDEAMLLVSRLGSTPVVIAGIVLLTLAAARRSHAVAYAVLLAAGSRPLMEWTLKELADRPRPAFDRMVPGTGPAFPSGHVLAAIALWCLLPAVVALYTHRTQLIGGCVIAGWLIVAAVAASRVYLGVHWVTDVAAAMLLGPAYLTLVAAAARVVRDGPRSSPDEMAASKSKSLPDQDPPVEPIPTMRSKETTPMYQPGRRHLLAMTALTLVAAVFVAGCAVLPGGSEDEDQAADHGRRGRIQPVATSEADWQAVADTLGRPGALSADSFVYRVGFPRSDLQVSSYDVAIKPGLALGSYAAFVRYRDGRTQVMGDLVVTEEELQAVTDALHANGLDQTAVHKHLLAHQPDIWWTHYHGLARDPAALAQGVRAALDQTGTPPPAPPTPPPPLDLDTAGIDAALGTDGRNDGGIYRFSFARDETITDHHRVLPPGVGITTAINFQPVGDGQAAINGDFVMTSDEVQDVIQALRAGDIAIVEIHNHGLGDHPRLFYMHFWAVDDAVSLATTLRDAFDSTNTHPT